MDNEWARFWVRGGVEHLHARYVTHTFAPHTHEGYVIAVIEDSVEAFRYRGSSYHATPGHVIFINPGEVHTGNAGVERGWLYRPFYPSSGKLKSATQGTGAVAEPYFAEALVYDPELALGEAFLELTICAVTRYADGAFRPAKVAREPGAVEQVKAYLEAYTSANVTLADLADLTGLSTYAVLRAFRRQTGLTPHAYQVQRRVENAKKRLQNGEAIATVAVETGFFDQSHLTKHFKRVVGVTPNTFVQGSASAISS